MQRELFCNIGASRVGPSSNPFIVAELSANHRGSLNKALELVRLAAENGADAVKVQTFTADGLTINTDKSEFFIRDESSPWVGKRLWDLYKEAETPSEWHRPIAAAARDYGLAFISSAFDLDSIDFLEGIGADAIKISSFEFVHHPLIRKAALTETPLLLSTGMASFEEINEVLAILSSCGKENFVLLRCVSAYPATELDANLASLIDLQARFGCLVGFSDHCLAPYSAFTAIALGACVVEKHFTDNREAGGLDASFSIEPTELRELSVGCTKVFESTGEVKYGAQQPEAVSLRERPSIYVSKRIPAGGTFNSDNVRIIRPGYGLSPKYYYDVLGAKAAVALEVGTALTWEMITDR